MKKFAFLSVLLAVFVSVFFAEDAPVKSGGWRWDDGVNLNGKVFFDVAESYREQDGWAFIEGFGKIHYWLYDTYTYWNGDGQVLVDKCVAKWIESMGYVIDFDNVRAVTPNNDLASSVKSLMVQRGCDVSVALITRNPSAPYVVVNNYYRDGDSYWTLIYPLIK